MFDHTLLANDDILFFDEDFSKVIFFANEMGILGVNVDKTNFDDNKNLFEDHPDTIHVRLLPWCNKFEKHKSCKKDMQRITDCSMAFNKMVEMVLARR